APRLIFICRRGGACPARAAHRAAVLPVVYPCCSLWSFRVPHARFMSVGLFARRSEGVASCCAANRPLVFASQIGKIPTSRGFAPGGGRGFLSGTRLRAQRGEEFFVRQSVDDVARFEPAAPRRLDPVFHDLKLRRRM